DRPGTFGPRPVWSTGGDAQGSRVWSAGPESRRVRDHLGSRPSPGPEEGRATRGGRALGGSVRGFVTTQEGSWPCSSKAEWVGCWLVVGWSVERWVGRWCPTTSVSVRDSAEEGDVAQKWSPFFRVLHGSPSSPCSGEEGSMCPSKGTRNGRSRAPFSEDDLRG